MQQAAEYGEEGGLCMSASLSPPMPLRELQERRKSSAESSVATATATTKSRKPSLQSNVTEPPALSMDFLHDRDSASDTASTKSSNFVVKEVTKFGQAMAPRRPS
eukprot:Sspe_Gene.29742::Locus_14297_Transcript_1_1_Confidence_1.000_Length_401::g.29742::m.29742